LRRATITFYSEDKTFLFFFNTMKKNFPAVCLLISANFVLLYGSALTFYAGNDYYFTKDLIDTTAKEHTLYFDLGLGLDDIGGSGVSFHSDLLATNAFNDGVTSASARKQVEMTTGYLDWRSEQGGTKLRLGRQRYNNLVYDRYDLDGARLTIRPNSEMSFGAVYGLAVPSPYAKIVMNNVLDISGNPTDSFTTEYKHYLLSDPKKASVMLFDGSVSMIPFTTLNASFGIVPAPYMHPQLTGYDTLNVFDPVSGLPGKDTVPVFEEPGKDDVRAALGVNVSPEAFVRFSGSARYSNVHKGLDRLDGRLTIIPAAISEISAYYFMSKGQIDSTNYLAYMFLDQLQEIGASADFFPDKVSCIHLDYHVITSVNEGADHFFTFNASNRALFGGVTLSTGYNGTVIHPYSSARFPFWKVFTLDAAVDFYRIFRTEYKSVPYDTSYVLVPAVTLDPLTGDTLSITTPEWPKCKKIRSPYNVLHFSGGIRLDFSSIGLSIHPRAEYIINRYYKQDVRFLLTTKLLIFNYWEGRE
jgi:hypothetical protein